MALTASIVQKFTRGWGARGGKVASVIFTTDTDYQTGGYSVSSSVSGLGYFSGGITGIVPMGPQFDPGTTKFILSYNPTGDKLLVISTADGAEASAGEDALSGLTFPALVFGS